MPAEYILIPERRLVLTFAYDQLDGAQIIDHARRLRLEPAFEPDFRQFADLSGLRPSDVSPDVFVPIRGSYHPFYPDAYRSIYAPHEVPFGFSPMFEMLLTDKHMLVTRSREEAERHVGLEAGESLSLRERVFA